MRGPRALSVTAQSPSLAPSELRDAKAVAKRLGLNHRVIQTLEVEREDYRANDSNRCYFCKDELYTTMTGLAKDEGYAFVANGTKADDLGHFRTGQGAAKRHGVRTPLVQAGRTQDAIRLIQHASDRPTRYNRPEA